MALLKHIYSYCLIFTVLLFATLLQQCLKIPALLEHYREHKMQQPGLAFADFMFMHYIGDDGVADDENKDMQLPFKKSDRNPTSFEAYYSTAAALFCHTIRPLCTRYALFKVQFLPDPQEGDLLKPPQV